LRSEIDSDHFALFPNPVSSQQNVYSSSATKIHNYVAGLKIREACGVATAPREVKRDLWDQ
jgi:hypothetical protein